MATEGERRQAGRPKPGAWAKRAPASFDVRGASSGVTRGAGPGTKPPAAIVAVPTSPFIFADYSIDSNRTTLRFFTRAR